MPKLVAPRQFDAAYLDFVEGLKLYNYTTLVPLIFANYEAQSTDSYSNTNPSSPQRMAEAGALISPTLLYKFACGLQRASQEMAWEAAERSVEPSREIIISALDRAAATQEFAKLELDPNFTVPDWYTKSAETGVDDIHLEPYWGNPIIGAVYSVGSGVYRTSWRRTYGLGAGFLKAFAKASPVGEYLRILDIGCSFGASTIAVRQAFPDATEVVGVDLSAEALRWAQATAEEHHLRITFTQGDTSATAFESDSFDLVTAHLLMHEMPADRVDATVREMFRVLRPGGHLKVLDIPRYGVLAPEVAFIQSYDQKGNGENFWDAFLTRDLPSILASAGFVEVTERPLPYEDPDFWGAAALLRDGQFHAFNRWLTTATKPGA